MVAIITTDLIEISDCDSTSAGGTWSGDSVSSDSIDPDPLEGTGWVGGVLKKDGNAMMFTPTSSIDMSGTHLRWIFMTILKPNLFTLANNGVTLTITGSTSGVAVFNVSGSDKYVGGWEVIVINPYATPDSGTQVVGNVVSAEMTMGIGTAAKNIVTTNMDWMSYGTGLKAYSSGTDVIGMSEINDQDTYYLLAKYTPDGIYRLTGKFQLGDDDSTNNCYFSDSGKVVIFADLFVDSDFYEFKVIGNTTGTTTVSFTGMFVTAVGEKYNVDMTDATNVTSIDLSGTTFQNATTIDLSSVVNAIATVFDACGAIDPGGAALDGCTIKNSTVSGTTTGSLVVNVDTEAEACDNMFFSEYTGATTYAVFVDSSVTEFDMNNWTFDDPNNTTSYALYWEGSAGTLTINALSGTNLTTAGCTSAGGTIDVASSVALTLSGLQAGSEVRAYTGTNPATSVEISGIESSTTSYVISHSSGGVDGYIQIHKENYESMTIWLTYASTNGEIPIQQRFDRNYSN